MAIVFQNVDAGNPDSQSPMTHALIIGIGGYTHLEGGASTNPGIKNKIGILGQLTTAPRSARAFADFVISAASQWRVPLGSVDLILSAKPGDDNAIPDNHPATAGFDDIQTAYDNWRERCDTHTDNMALFYFCGHGVEKEEQYLLAEDFGKSTNSPWRGSFAIDSTMLGFRSCKANTQCFFIDACREITSPLKNEDINALPLETPRLAQRESEFTFQMKSTAGKETALGPPDGVAYGTQALISALKGDAATSDNNKWVVRTANIADKITDILGMIKKGEDFRQRCPCNITKSTPIIEWDHPPQIELTIECTPDTAVESAQIMCKKIVLPGDPAPEVHSGVGQALHLSVEAGMYFAEATFAGQEFKNVASQFTANPPSTNTKLDCKLP